MKTVLKYTTAAVIAGALALVAATPSNAEHGRNAAAAIGFGAGALVGAAVANSANHSYYYGPGYYEPDYAYAPAPTYYEPAPRYRAYNAGSGCWHVTDSTRGYGYYGAC